MDVKPVPLLEFGGLDRKRDPFLAKPGTWQSLNNGFTYRGRMRKRAGYSYKQHLGIATSETIGSSGSTNYIAVLSQKKVLVEGPIEIMTEVDDPWVQEYFTGPRARAAQVKG